MTQVETNGDGDQHAPVCECIHCGLDHEFELPEELRRAAHVREVVIFAGAGISTEVPTVFPQTIYRRAAEKLGLTDPGSFPEVIEAYEKEFGRREFVQMVKAKFDYIDSFWGLRYDARKFHKELATMPYMQDIVTTNWDTYFEEECAATAFVTGEDIALWRMPGRRVLKIHGSMTNLGSLVATEADYKRRLKELRKGVMGGLLTELLATRTVVFIGYSLTDWNFRRLYRELRKDMGQYTGRVYFVSPFGASPEDEEGFGFTTLKTSGVKFLKELKRENLGNCNIDDSSYERVAEYHAEILDADTFARTVPHRKYPSVIYCWSFHDGARDAGRRIELRRGSGEYSSRSHVVRLVKLYESLAEAAWDNDRFREHAYIEGYLAPLYIMLDDRPDESGNCHGILKTVPYYFMYGADDDSLMRSQEEFRDAVKASARRAPKQRKAARERLGDLPDDMVLEHPPFLTGLRDENIYAVNEHAD